MLFTYSEVNLAYGLTHVLLVSSSLAKLQLEEMLFQASEVFEISSFYNEYVN